MDSALASLVLDLVILLLSLSEQVLRKGENTFGNATRDLIGAAKPRVSGARIQVDKTKLLAAHIGSNALPPDLASYILPGRSIHPIRTGNPNLTLWESGQRVPDENVVASNQRQYRLQLFVTDGDERMLGSIDSLKCAASDTPQWTLSGDFAVSTPIMDAAGIKL